MRLKFSIFCISLSICQYSLCRAFDLVSNVEALFGSKLDFVCWPYDNPKQVADRLCKNLNFTQGVADGNFIEYSKVSVPTDKVFIVLTSKMPLRGSLQEVAAFSLGGRVKSFLYSKIDCIENKREVVPPAPDLLDSTFFIPDSNILKEYLWHELIHVDEDSRPDLFARDSNQMVSYFGKSIVDHRALNTHPQRVKMSEEGGQNWHIGTSRSYHLHVDVLGLRTLIQKREPKRRVLSLGEGNSDFTLAMLNLGWDAWSVDATVRNPHAPERSLLAFAQNLPFQSELFDLTVSYYLFPHFFINSDHSMFNPLAGRMALLEAIRVTKIGGEIRIGPMLKEGSEEMDAFLMKIREKGLIHYEVVQPEERLLKKYVNLNKVNTSVHSEEFTYAKITRLR